MYLRLALNFLHFHPVLGVLYALRSAPNFYEIHPKVEETIQEKLLKTFFGKMPNSFFTSSFGF